jgi:hypothetical protein
MLATPGPRFFLNHTALRRLSWVNRSSAHNADKIACGRFCCVPVPREARLTPRRLAVVPLAVEAPMWRPPKQKGNHNGYKSRSRQLG